MDCRRRAAALRDGPASSQISAPLTQSSGQFRVVYSRRKSVVVPRFGHRQLGPVQSARLKHCSVLRAKNAGMGKGTTIPRVLLWVEAGKGFGHFRIVAELIRSLQKRRCETIIASSRPNVVRMFGAAAHRTFKLPDLGADTWGQAEVSSHLVHGRTHKLLQVIKSERPNCLVIEMWPARRGVFDVELLKAIHALRHVRPDALVVCLVRDIPFELVPAPVSRPRLSVAAKLARDFVDLILVRGDGQISLAETWPEAETLRSKISYPGYFGGQRQTPKRTPGLDWVFSMGGGWFEQADLLSKLVADCHGRHGDAASICRAYLPQEHWQPHQSQFIYEEVGQSFQPRMETAGLAILQAGYNSVIEAIHLSVPAVFVTAANPFTSGEQRFRLQRFTKLGIIGERSPWQTCDTWAASALDDAVAKSLASDGSRSPIRLDGQERAADLILQAMAA